MCLCKSHRNRDYPLSKLNAVGLSCRKWTKLFRHPLIGRVVGSCRLQCRTICSRVCTSAWPHGQLLNKLGKNRCLYSPIGACPVIKRVARAHRL